MWPRIQNGVEKATQKKGTKWNLDIANKKRLLYSYLLLDLSPASIAHTYKNIEKKVRRKMLSYTISPQVTNGRDFSAFLASALVFTICLGLFVCLLWHGFDSQKKGSTNTAIEKVGLTEQDHLYFSCFSLVASHPSPSSWSILLKKQAWLLACQDILTFAEWASQSCGALHRREKEELTKVKPSLQSLAEHSPSFIPFRTNMQQYPAKQSFILQLKAIAEGRRKYYTPRPTISATVAVEFWVSHSSSGNWKNVKYAKVMRMTAEHSADPQVISSFLPTSFFTEAHRYNEGWGRRGSQGGRMCQNAGPRCINST